jgi:hypothetical protein
MSIKRWLESFSIKDDDSDLEASKKAYNQSVIGLIASSISVVAAAVASALAWNENHDRKKRLEEEFRELSNKIRQLEERRYVLNKAS